MRLLITAVLVLFAGAATAANLTSNVGTTHGHSDAQCELTCPAGAIDENEPVCYDGYYDATNGGCNSVGWTDLCPQSGNVATACGTAGTFYYGYYSYRDTDWFRAYSDGSPAASVCIEAEFAPFVILISQPAGGINCYNYTYVYTFGVACNAAASCATGYVGAQGTEFWPWAGTQVFGYGVPCGSEYIMTVSGAWCGGTANEAATWGTVKALYQ
jgi:hypothetical protein